MGIIYENDGACFDLFYYKVKRKDLTQRRKEKIVLVLTLRFCVEKLY